MRVLASFLLFLAVASAAPSVHPLKASSELFGRVRNFELISISEHSRSFDHQRYVLNAFREESYVSQPRALQLKFGAFGKEFHLDLEVNEALFGKSYREFGMLNGGTVIKNTNLRHEIPNCFYQGYDRSAPTLRSAVDTCNGFRGLVHAHGEAFFVEPAAPHIDGFSSATEHSVTGSQHIIYKLAEIEQGDWACGVKDSESGATHYHPLESAGELAGSVGHTHSQTDDHGSHDHFRSHAADHAGLGSGFRTQATQKWVELLIVNDHERYLQKGSSTVYHSASLVNIAQTMYSNSVPFGLEPAISLVLIGQVTFLDSNSWGEPTKNSAGQVDSSALLSNFSFYRVTHFSSLPTHDDAHLLSGNTFIPPTIGLARKPGTCSYSAQNGIEQATGLPDIIVGITLAHEMGHNFNLSHDPVSPDPCAGFVMQASICAQCSSQPSRFSNCSIAQFDAFTATIGCLNNDPGALRWDNPTICGDGFVEGNEQCDCGSTVDCTTSVPSSRQDTCCNAATCTLVSQAVCSNLQPCCQGCQVITTNTTVCRAASGSCDQAEFCNGTSANCPADIYKTPGTACTDSNGGGACYQGTCHTVASQCITYGYQYKESCLGIATDCVNIGCWNGASCVTLTLAGALPEDGTVCSSAGEGGICVSGSCNCRALNNSVVSCPAGPSDNSDNKAVQFFKDNWLWIAIAAGAGVALLLLYCCCCRKSDKPYDPDERPRKKINPALELNRTPHNRERGDSMGVPVRNVANSVGGGPSGHLPYMQPAQMQPSQEGSAQYNVVPSPQSAAYYSAMQDSQSASQYNPSFHQYNRSQQSQ